MLQSVKLNCIFKYKMSLCWFDGCTAAVYSTCQYDFFYLFMYDLYNIVTATTATTNNAKNESFVEQ